MIKRFTDLAVRNAKAGKVRREIPDPGCAGLYLIVQVSGHRSYAVRYRIFGRPRKLTLGTVEKISLATAHKLCGDALEKVAKNIDPGEEKQAINAKARAARENSLEAVCLDYLKDEGAQPEADKLRTLAVREATLARLVFPTLGKMPIESVKRSNLMQLIRKIKANSGPRQADIVLKYLSVVFGWYAVETDGFISPIIKGMSDYDAKAHQRTRVLNDDELRAVWKASETGGAFGALVRFLLLTAARRGEAAGLTRSEIDGAGIWTLPAIRNKTKTELARPLSKAALAVVDAQPIIDGEPRVFGALSFGQGKTKFDAACGVTAWRLHDLRRTARTLLSRAGVRPDVAERCLGHALPGIQSIYDLHTYLTEMSAAFERLSALILNIINPTENVTPMVRRRERDRAVP